MPKGMPWWRAYAEMVDDEKLRLLAFEDRWHFIALCCLKCSGLLDEPYSDLKTRKISVKLGLRLPELDEVKRRLMEVGLVDEDFIPVAWENRQFVSDLKDPSAAERMRRYRQRKLYERNDTVTLRPPESDTDTESDTEEEKNARVTRGEKIVADLKRIYPKREGSQRWADCQRYLNALLKSGEKEERIYSGVSRYKTYCEAKGIIGTDSVQQAATFFGRNRGYLEDWKANPGAKNATRRNLSAAERVRAANRERIEREGDAWNQS